MKPHDTPTALFILRGIADVVERHGLTVLSGELCSDGMTITVPLADFLRAWPSRHTRYPRDGGFRYLVLLDVGSVRAEETAAEVAVRVAANATDGVA